MAKKLTLSERVELYKFRRMGAGVREIARTLHRSPWAICEELKHFGSEVNRGTDYIFVAHEAHAQAKRIRSLASSCDAA
jgi:IS30 family transposase